MVVGGEDWDLGTVAIRGEVRVGKALAPLARHGHHDGHKRVRNDSPVRSLKCGASRRCFAPFQTSTQGCFHAFSCLQRDLSNLNFSGCVSRIPKIILH